MNKIFTMNEASRFLTKVLPHKTREQWWGYLKHNPRKWREQDGIRLCHHLANGEIVYTEASLLSFARAFKPTKSKANGVE